MAKILFVEDDSSLISGLSFAIQKAGHEVLVASTKREALRKFTEEQFHLIILDVTLPDGDGYEICEQIRMNSKVPIIFLTAKDDEMDITRGLDIGGDDYITKPFKLSVLMSRIGAILRRCSYENDESAILRSNDISIDHTRGEVYKGDKKLELTQGEYRLLNFFLSNQNQVLSPEQILSNLWDSDERFIDSSTLTVYIRRLRKKIEDDPSNPRMISTVRGLGYRWNDGVQS